MLLSSLLLCLISVGMVEGGEPDLLRSIPAVADFEKDLARRCDCEEFRVRWKIGATLLGEIVSLDQVSVEPLGSDRYGARDADAPVPDRIMMRIEGLRSGRPVELLVAGEPECRLESYRALRALPKGTVLTPDDIRSEMNWVPPTALRAGEFDPVGRFAVRSVQAGRWIESTDLREPPLVKRGGVVQVIYKTSGLDLRGRGVVRGDGWKGDLLTVRVEGAEHDCRGIVVGPSEVRIDIEEGLR